MTTLEDRDLKQVVDLVAVNVEDCIDRIEDAQKKQGRLLQLIAERLGITTVYEAEESTWPIAQYPLNQEGPG